MSLPPKSRTGSLLTPDQRKAYEEAVSRGLSMPLPSQLLNPVLGYRKAARPKQLPPDTKNYVERLRTAVVKNGAGEFITQDQTAHVRYVTVPGRGHNQPQTVSVADIDPKLFVNFYLWFILCGRGFGKTWTGSSWINEGARLATGEYMAIMGRDANDVRAFCVEGETGILKTARPDFYPNYEPSKKLITWPNGVKAQLFYAEEPKAVRGPNCFRAWCDEPASYQDAAKGLQPDDGSDTAMSNLLMTLRRGGTQLLVTGTPKPLPLIKDLLNWRGAIVVRGSMKENYELTPKFMEVMEEKYGGTRLGRQELEGELLEDTPNALWKRAWIDTNRQQEPPSLELVLVAIDPNASSSGGKAGLVGGGRWFHPIEERFHYYVLADESLPGSPEEWATAALNLFRRLGANWIVAERNNGGDMVEAVLGRYADGIPVRTVWASRGKFTRAEPVALLYEQGRVHHCGNFPELEHQQCNWKPGMASPDNMDALVWLITALSDDVQIGEDPELFKDFWNPGPSMDVESY